jgi:hypothetical protein
MRSKGIDGKASRGRGRRLMRVSSERLNEAATAARE